MPEETPKVEGQDHEAGNAGGDGGTSPSDGGLETAKPEELIEEIRKLRAENASKRVKSKEAAAELKAFEEWKRSQMSEAERLKADLEKARGEVAAAYVEVYADKYGVPAARRQFVRGNTKEEIEEACKVLGEPVPGAQAQGAQTSGQAPPAPVGLFPGVRGAAVGAKNTPGALSADEQLRAKLAGK